MSQIAQHRAGRARRADIHARASGADCERGTSRQKHRVKSIISRFQLSVLLLAPAPRTDRRARDRDGGAAVSALDPRTIVRILGGDVTGRNSCNVPGPGHSKVDRSLSITIDPRAPDGFLVYSFAAGDDPLYCKDYIRERLGLGSWEPGQKRRRQAPIKAAAPAPTPDPAEEKRKAWALKIWSESTNPTGTIVERYLREHRGLELIEGMAGSVVRFHRSLYFDEFNRRPGMVCLLRDVVTDEPCGIIERFWIGRPARRSTAGCSALRKMQPLSWMRIRRYPRR